jgi:hypothetical protein
LALHPACDPLHAGDLPPRWLQRDGHLSSGGARRLAELESAFWRAGNDTGLDGLTWLALKHTLARSIEIPSRPSGRNR